MRRHYLMCRPTYFAGTGLRTEHAAHAEAQELPSAAGRLAGALASNGYEPVPVNVSELHLAGGGPKCCTLEVRA